MILIPSVAPKLAWQRDQHRWFHVQNQEYSLKIKSFQIHICGHQHGKTAKQNVQVTRLVDTSPGRRTPVRLVVVGCSQATISPGFIGIAMLSVDEISVHGRNCQTVTSSERR
mmetsp:Transcript_62297/g.98565  ORF Transcript_62297/g.98565 Transcript_62297/m.98565 type:complete len:112 (-) Transcript_62297:697-1032(-)